MRIFIMGINGFIGTHLTEGILFSTDWEIEGFDINSSNLAPFSDNPKFSFRRGDIFKDNDWIEQKIMESDVVIPLAGIAKPAYYLQKPVWTFELDFEQNLKVIRLCSKHHKRIIFPSTSEVYGMSGDSILKEDESPLVTGPIKKMRWIYSCSKQMMDRIIFAYGYEEGLSFSIFRPFNWVGPRLDTFKDAAERKARSETQMIYDILHRGKVTLVNGGLQRRSFTWVGDGIDGLIRIIENKDGRAADEIFNIGNPYNNYSIKEMAEMLIDEMKKIPAFKEKADAAVLEAVPAETYYGKTYDDIQNRMPSIEKMELSLGWKPETSMREILQKTLYWYAEQEKIN
jgi:nucleoside-diphosphate-sugar epimerase